MIQLLNEPGPAPLPRWRQLWPFGLAAAALGMASWLVWAELAGSPRHRPVKEAPAPASPDGDAAGEDAFGAEEARGGADLAVPPSDTEPPAEVALAELEPAAATDDVDAPVVAIEPGDGKTVRFEEVWAYLMPGEEGLWRPEAPLTDLALFDYSLDSAGRLKGKVNRQALERARARSIRTHVVVAASGATLLHLALSPLHSAREQLLNGIVELARGSGAQGVQLDFEGSRAEDRADLVSFVRELRGALPPGTIFSLALPAKTKDVAGAVVYADMAALADRFFIMVYDQHWRGGPPGAIATYRWHDQVLDCVLQQLPIERVVVGLPLYGRLWQREEVARAVKHSRALELAKSSGTTPRRDPGGGSTFTFRTEVTAECWFEDAHSLERKLRTASRKGFRAVGFWRLGQEDIALWRVIGRSR